MTRQPVYRVMTQGTKTWVIETPGYLYDINCPQGTVRIGLIYKRPYWFATHYESGLDCTPYSDKGGYKKEWRSKDLLLEALTRIDFHRYLAQAQPYIDRVNKYKGGAV